MNLLSSSMLLLALFALVSCAGHPTKNTSESEPDKVVSRIDNLDERPSWVKEGEPFRIENGSVISTGMTTIPGNNRVEAAYRIAQNNAKAGISGAIEQRLNFIFQNAEEGTSVDATQARYIGAEASKLVTSSIRPGKNYWEKVAVTQDSGERVTQYKVFTSVTMPETDFKRAIMDAIRKQQGKGGLSADFAKKVDQHWEQFANEGNATTNHLDTKAEPQATKTRTPASTDGNGQ